MMRSPDEFGYWILSLDSVVAKVVTKENVRECNKSHA